ncbi:MAG TPA: GNAT family N-acetyltransferase [Kofleriaceae bacterium]|jgi:CelD/BcsL family acetyltransferase involved in cellulose biosynthesis|nr:GNAT family N-acetyltransferase [Kofleriaceae bacterium]
MQGSLVGLSEVRHRPGWRHWQQLTADAPPFLGPEFFTLAAPLSDGTDPVVASAWDGETMVGALPLVRDHHALRGLRCDYTPGYDYCGSPEGVDAIWQALRRDPSWSELTLIRIPADSPLATRLPSLATADGCPSILRREPAHLYFPLPGFEHALSPKFRSNLLRCERKAGGVELERIAVPDRAAFDDALAIEAMAWKGAAGTAIEADPRAEHLYRALARLVGRRGRGALYFLRAGGRRIATLVAVEDRHTLYALKIGYDPGVYNLSPGHLLVWKVAADAEARGLREFDFVGRNDDWKRKWTDRGREQVTIVVYRDTARGLAHYALSVLVRPHLPETLRDGLRSPLPRSCQRADLIGVHTLVGRVRGRLDRGLGIKSGIKRLIKPPPPRDPVGQPSAFAPGSWVRVKSADELRATLDARDRTRGLLFTDAQWQTAGKVFRTARHVRRLRDDHGQFRPVSRTVLLDGIDCAGDEPTPTGCGRHCPMMYRDEWLEPSSAPPRAPGHAHPARHARVRDLDEILAGLDLRGRRDGLTFMPEMKAYAGKRFAIANQLTTVFEYDRWTATRAPIYILDGLHCTGAVLGDRGPCDRGCALMWHEDWLLVEPEPRA